MSKKILIHSLVFSPDGVSTAYLYNDIAVSFKLEGFDVSVITTTPHYNVVEGDLQKQPLRRKALGLYYQSDYKGITVKHVYQKKFKSTFLRLFGFVYWHIVSLIIAMFEKKIDYILSPSPPLTIGFLNILIGKIKGSKVIYNVQEIYPDLLIEKGGLRSKPVINLFKWLERIVYDNSHAITTIDQVFCKIISCRLKDKSKLHLIPNFVDVDIYKPTSIAEKVLNETLFPKNGTKKLMYAGNIGYAQDWITLIELATELKEESFEFFVIGQGAMSDFLEKEKISRKLEKLHIIAYQPRELIPALMAYSDLQFIFMAPQTEGHGFPSKVYTIMACAKPMMVCSGENTPIINFLSDKNCAYLFTERQLEIKVHGMAKLLRGISKEDLKIKGQNGCRIIKSTYTKEIVTQQYVDLVNSL